MLKLGWFSTGRGSGSRNLLRLVQEEIIRGEIPATIQFVFQNREHGEAEGSDLFQDLVHSFGLPLVPLSSHRFRKERSASSFTEVREEFDSAVMHLLKDFQPDICVLAGYMLYASEQLCKQFTMINTHPALPNGPIGTWPQVIWQLIDEKATETGAMVHLATEQWDRGPVISYFSFPLRGELFDSLWANTSEQSIEKLRKTYGEKLELFQRIREEGVKREPYLLLETIRDLSQRSVRIAGRQVIDNQGNPIGSYCLNDRIEATFKKI